MMFAIFPSAGARTASENSNSFGSFEFRGARFYLNITAVGAGTLDVKIQGYDDVSNTWVDVPGASFAQKSGAGMDDLTIYPGIAETANETVSDVLPSTYRAVATVSGGGSITFTLGADLLR